MELMTRVSKHRFLDETAGESADGTPYGTPRGILERIHGRICDATPE